VISLSLGAHSVGTGDVWRRYTTHLAEGEHQDDHCPPVESRDQREHPKQQECSRTAGPLRLHDRIQLPLRPHDQSSAVYTRGAHQGAPIHAPHAQVKALLTR
jgi:hypothetical protein